MTVTRSATEGQNVFFSAGVVVVFGLYSSTVFRLFNSWVCQIGCHLFVHTIRLQCEFTQIVMLQSVFQSRSEIVLIGWWFSETTWAFNSPPPTPPVSMGSDFKSVVLLKYLQQKWCKQHFISGLVFKIHCETEGQSQWSPRLKRILTVISYGAHRLQMG